MSQSNWGAPPSQYPPGPYYQPVPQQPQPQKSNTGMIVVSVIAVLLAIALAAGLAYYFAGQRGTESAGKSGAMSTVQTQQDRPTVTQTVNAPPAAPQQQQPQQQQPQRSQKTYSSYDRDSSTTSASFASAVYSAFKANYNGNPNITLYSVYSPATGGYYDMYCVDEGSRVACRGGDGAAVYIY